MPVRPPQLPITHDRSRRDYCLYLVAGEHSGDALGGKLMAALNERIKGRVRYLGVGGEAMAAQGLASQFPLSDVAVMGFSAIVPKLPTLITRVYGTARAALAANPDAVVIIDSPEFTHPIAKRIRKWRPELPIIDYVSPSVWAWRPGRAPRMARYVDHVLGLLPFEPEAHARLGGPPCSYVGHPLIERLPWLQSLDPQPLASKLELNPDRPVLVVLPGSRPTEVGRLMGVFGETVAVLKEKGIEPEIIIPSVRSVRGLIEAGIARWPVQPHLVEGDEDKFRAFRLARAALAASGTVTLELALAGTPMVVAYKLDAVASRLRFLLQIPTVVLANLVLGEQAFPEFIQEQATAPKLAAALAGIMEETPARQAQLDALARIPERLMIPGGSPSAAAADIVLSYAETGRKTG